MKKTTRFLVLILTILPLAWAAAKTLMPAEAIEVIIPGELSPSQTGQAPADEAERPVTNDDFSCAEPRPIHAVVCQQMEQQILASTVNILINSPLTYVEGFGYRIISGSGHGTIKDGRYLVTHNHFDEHLFDLLQQGDPDGLITITLFDSRGELILQVPAAQISVVVAGQETTLFDFGEEDGVGVFTALGLPSARFVDNVSFSLRPGMEVAQIDWDGTTTHVDWVKIESITTKSGTPIVTVNNCVGHGASGGGLYWQGTHIGNNWSRSGQCSLGTAERQVELTTVALNSTQITIP